MMNIRWRFAFCSLLILGNSCAPTVNEPIPGPDKQASGMFYGAILGAGSGAITGAQLSAGTGPGAFAGAGIGAVFGLVSGLGKDLLEEDEYISKLETARLQETSWAQGILAQQYEKRLELHPSRDIFPADLFFSMDEVKLRSDSAKLVTHLAHLVQRRKPWSRIVIASYTATKDPESSYAKYLGEQRTREIALEFVRAGIEPRRVNTQVFALSDPILVDPADHPSRYYQAIELLLID